MAEDEKAAPGSWLGLNDRVCVVTGGGSGIGRGIALALAAQRARVAVLDRDEASAGETVALMPDAGGAGIALGCDVSSQDSVEAACVEVRDRFGDAQVLVNNAAISRPGPIAELTLADWNALLAVNLTGYFLCSQVFGRAMRAKRDGALVHVASLGAEFVIPFAGAYSVAKAGIAMLSRQIAVEWGPDGVRSNVVHPGFVQTPRTQPAYEKPGAMEMRSQAIPAKRIGRAEDIADAVVYLASPRAAYVSGAEMMVDGGFTRNLMGLIPGAGQLKSKP
jgi:NAD(P)-dependent dehydrogenase (short-subunit alcohol dehydrogenase family)